VKNQSLNSMITLLKKDVLGFFSSWLGWGTISSFFVLMGIYVWVIDGNVLDFGFAELSVFFQLSPWLFMFLVPALAMGSISEEVDRGTFQLLRSLPVSLDQILLAKTGSLAMLILIVLLPSLLFVYSIGSLGLSLNNFDNSLIVGGYIALSLLNLSFIVLGLLASSLSKKQPVAFLLGLVLNFIFWQGAKEIGWDAIDLFAPYSRMSMGLIHSSDVLFFSGFIIILLGIIRIRLSRII
jgi:ABC-2 type transport system permease protein